MPCILALGATQMATENERVPISAETSQALLPAGAVFLGYACEDAAAAQLIATALRSAGIEVWFDRAELRGGDAWDRGGWHTAPRRARRSAQSAGYGRRGFAT